MLFNSIQFIVFLTLVMGLFSVAPRQFRKYILLAASLYFYATWNVAYLVLILIVITVSYLYGLSSLGAATREKSYGILAIGISLAVLAFFKYSNFMLETFDHVAGIFSTNIKLDPLSILLPVGISFYTFQAISYVIDVKARRVAVERNIVDYALYISFFPQLVAGPIERASNILPQIKNRLIPRIENIIPAFSLIISGFFKKMVIADRLCFFVDLIYQDPHSASPEQAVVAFYFFAFQVYCDFSGYTDIARGVAKLFNIDLMENFNKPYLADSIREFWRRWHISLSTWFRDYIYIPLGGNRQSKYKVFLNIMVVFTLCGLWHGAAYTFVLWGLLHGILICIEHGFNRLFNANGKPGNVFIKTFKILLTFHLVSILWVFFRSNTIDMAFLMIGKLAHFHSLGEIKRLILADHTSLLGFVMIMALILSELLPFIKLTGQSETAFKIVNITWQIVGLCAVLTFGIFDNQPFIYFQF